jgi:bifunctional non-homologous end joining protein LigD
MISHRELMVCTALHQAFTRAGWLFEVKYDGFRVLVIRDPDRVRLLSRRGNDMAESFPELVDGLQRLPASTVLDGELVVLDEFGHSDFERLRRRAMTRKKILVQHRAVHEPAAILAFDLLMLKGRDIRRQPLIKRKKMLERTVKKLPRVLYASHIGERGEHMFEKVSGLKLEGIVAKRADSVYVAGRSHDWVKIKTEHGRNVDAHRLKHLRE